MKIPKKVKLIETNSIKISEKDEIEILNERGFIFICKSQKFTEIFRRRYETSTEFTDYYYLIGTEVMYIFNEQIRKGVNKK